MDDFADLLSFAAPAGHRSPQALRANAWSEMLSRSIVDSSIVCGLRGRVG